MEFNEGKIKPTTTDESAAYRKLLKAQTESNYGEDTQAPKVRKGAELSETDSYKLFCSMEKVLHQGNDFVEFDDNELKVVTDSIRTLAQSHLGVVASKVDGFSMDSAGSIEPASRSVVVEMAGRAMRPSYEE